MKKLISLAVAGVMAFSLSAGVFAETTPLTPASTSPAAAKVDVVKKAAKKEVKKEAKKTKKVKKNKKAKKAAKKIVKKAGK